MREYFSLGCRDRGSFTRGIGEMDAVQEVRLCPSDIPGAELSKPYQVHTVSALRWWLLCRGIRFPTSWKKQKIIDRCMLQHVFLYFM